MIASLVNSIRKIWHFLVGIFPVVGRLAGRLGRWLELLVTNPVVAPIWNRIVGSRQGQALLSVIQRFWWRDYSKERVDASALPPEAAAILRPAMVVAVTVALLAPVVMVLPGPTLPEGAVDPAQGPVASWSVVLWILAVAVAWGALLLGAGAANRPAALIALALFLYFAAYAASSAPPSFWNALVPVTAVLALAMSEARLRCDHWWARAVGLLISAVVGLFAGFLAVGMIPLGERPLWLKLAVGATLAAAAFAWSRLARPADEVGAPLLLRLPAEPRVFRLLGLLVLLFYLSLWWRAGLGAVATGVVESLGLWTGYLWPAWYLLGTGIIYKLLKHAKVISDGVRDVVPRALLVPAVIGLFLVGSLLTWSEYVLDTTGLPWPGALVGLATWVYGHSLDAFWSEPLYAFSATPMRWVLLFQLAAAVWLAIRRRLTTGAATTLLFQAVLMWFVFTQYYFNLLSFNRQGSPSLLAVAGTALMILWLVYRNGLKMALGSSPRWPSTARVAVFCAVLLFLLLEVHARTAIHDSLALDRIFYLMFRGLLEFGLPYFLLVYASRRLGELPLPTPRLLGAFSVGAATAVVLNAADKLVMAGGSGVALMADLRLRLETLLAGNMEALLGMAPSLPMPWTVLRAVLGMVAVVAVAWLLTRPHRRETPAPSVAIFQIVAVATGLSSFAQIRVDIPLVPPLWAGLLAPYRWSNEFDAHIFATHLAHWIPALMLALAVARRRPLPTGRWLGAAAVAVAVHVAAAVVWPRHEAWLQSSGMLFTSAVAAAGTLVLLLRATAHRIDRETPPAAGAGAVEPVSPAVGPRALVAMVVLVGLVLGAVAHRQVRAGRLLNHRLAGLSRPLDLPAAWEPSPEAPEPLLAVFSRPTVSSGRSLLTIDLRRPEGGDIPALMEEIVAELGQLLPDLELVGRPELWDRHLPDALAQSFFYSTPRPDGTSELTAGTVALLPVGDGPCAVLGLLSNLHDHGRLRWDLKVAAGAWREP